mgnify:CR=1 FL=1
MLQKLLVFGGFVVVSVFKSLHHLTTGHSYPAHSPIELEPCYSFTGKKKEIKNLIQMLLVKLFHLSLAEIQEIGFVTWSIDGHVYQKYLGHFFT